MDASCKIQRSIHDVHLTYKYVSRILGTYHNRAFFLKCSHSYNFYGASTPVPLFFNVGTYLFFFTIQLLLLYMLPSNHLVHTKFFFHSPSNLVLPVFYYLRMALTIKNLHCLCLFANINH